MPRLLDELPRWGHVYYLDMPRRDGGTKKDMLVPGTYKDGEEYMHPRWKPKRRFHPMTTYNVICTACLDAGCDRCPTEEQK
jgi:hypothetical protein